MSLRATAALHSRGRSGRCGGPAPHRVQPPALASLGEWAETFRLTHRFQIQHRVRGPKVNTREIQGFTIEISAIKGMNVGA